MQSPISLRHVLFIALFCTTAAAVAQKSAQPGFTSWASLADALSRTHQKVYVVTLSHPHTRKTCHVESVTSTALLCKGSHLHKSGQFPQQDIAAIIDPANNAGAHFFFADAAVVGGLIAVAAILNPVAGIVVVVAALFWIPGTAMTMDSDTSAEFLYLNENAPVAIKP